MNTIAKLSITKDFLDHFHLPPRYLIIDEIHFGPNITIVIKGPFPSTIPDGSKVMVRITHFARPRRYIEWQWVYKGKPHGNPIEAVL